MSVCECGRSSDDEARFCRDCGRLLDGPESILLLSGDDRSEVAESVITRGGSPRQFWFPILGIAAVVLVGWGIQSALRSTPEVESGAPSGESAPTTTRPLVEPSVSSEEDEEDLGDDETETTAVEPDDESTSTASVGAPAVEAPVLGSDVGYDLLASTRGRPAIVDLDTGVTQYHEGPRVTPVAVSGPWLVTSTYSVVAVLRLDDLAGDIAPILDDDDIDFVDLNPIAGRTEPGQMWFNVYRSLGDNENWEPLSLLVDLASGSSIDHPLAGETPFWSFRFSDRFADGDGGLVTSPAGGIYATTGDGFAKVHDGRLIAADRRRALVETCDEALRCERSWFDRSTWRPLDLIPPDQEALLTAIVQETDWVFTFGLEGPTSAKVTNIETGQVVDPKMQQLEGSLVLPAISPDGRWLAHPGQEAQTITFRDLTTGESTEIVLEEPIEGPLFFIDE